MYYFLIIVQDIETKESQRSSLLNFSISRQLSYFHMKEYGHSRDFIVACIGKCFEYLAPEAALLASFCIPQLSA
jgi:hypothetical protein